MGTDLGPSPAESAADAVLGTVQIVVFAALALGPLVAGFLVGVGPPTYTAEVTDVTREGTEGGVAYADLDAASRATVDDLLAAEGDRLKRRTADPPAVLEPGERTVRFEEFAVRLSVSRSQTLRPGALVLGLLGSTLTVALGAVVAERDFLGGRSPE